MTFHRHDFDPNHPEDPFDYGQAAFALGVLVIAVLYMFGAVLR